MAEHKRVAKLGRVFEAKSMISIGSMYRIKISIRTIYPSPLKAECMRLLPTKNTYRSFVAIALLPAIGLPILFWFLALLNDPMLSVCALIVYVLPPTLLAWTIGISSQNWCTDGNPLFQGAMGLDPTFPLGYLFCTAVWLAIGYVAWLLTFGIRTKK
jgi:hypothetical protein